MKKFLIIFLSIFFISSNLSVIASDPFDHPPEAPPPLAKPQPPVVKPDDCSYAILSIIKDCADQCFEDFLNPPDALEILFVRQDTVRNKIKGCVNECIEEQGKEYDDVMIIEYDQK